MQKNIVSGVSPKKVLLINGSPRKEGNTFTALTEIANCLKQEGVESEIIWIGNKPIRGCIACGQCSAKGLSRCVYDDDICNSIVDKFASSDGFVFASPVYYGQPNGSLLCLMQRAFYCNSAAVQYKPAAAVTVCRRGGATAAFQTLQMPMQMLNMPIVTSQYWNIAYGRVEGEAAQDCEGMQTMRTLARNMAWMLKGLSTVADEKPVAEPRQALAFIR